MMEKGDRVRFSAERCPAWYADFTGTIMAIAHERVAVLIDVGGDAKGKVFGLCNVAELDKEE